MSLITEFRVGIAQRPVAFGQDCKAVLPHPEIDPWYLAYALRARARDVLDMVDRASHGTGRLDTRLIKGLPIALPELTEQRAIARVLRSFDLRIDWCRRFRSVLLRVASALVVAAESRAGLVALDSFAALSRKMISPENLAGESWTHYSLPSFDQGQEPLVEDGSTIKSGKFVVPLDSVLVSKLNPITPRVWLPRIGDDAPPIASSEFLPIVSEAVAAEVLFAILTSPTVNRQMLERVTGSTGSHQRVRPDDVMSLAVCNPLALDQFEVDALIAIGGLVRQSREESRTLRRLLDAALWPLVTGALRVDDRLLEDDAA